MSVQEQRSLLSVPEVALSTRPESVQRSTGRPAERPEYINGRVPDEGESLLQLAQLNEGSLIADSAAPVPHKSADGSNVVDLYLDQEKFRAAFAGDVDPRPPRSWRWRSARSRRRRL